MFDGLGCERRAAGCGEATGETASGEVSRHVDRLVEAQPDAMMLASGR